MAAKHDEQQLEEDPLRKQGQALDAEQAQVLYEQIVPLIAPPAMALLPQSDPTREQAQQLLSHWIEEGDSGAGSRLSELLQREAEEREGKSREMDAHAEEGGAGGHLDDDRRGTMTGDFIADSARDSGARSGRGDGEGEKTFGGDGDGDGDGNGDGNGDGTGTGDGKGDGKGTGAGT